MFNDQISTAGKVNCFTKCSLYLFGNSKLVKNGQAIIIIGYNLCFFRSYTLDIVLGIVENITVIYDDLVKIFIQEDPAAYWWSLFAHSVSLQGQQHLSGLSE